jgi:hypothetical protein
MSLAEFNERFVESDGYQAYYKGREIMQWFEGK